MFVRESALYSALIIVSYLQVSLKLDELLFNIKKESINWFQKKFVLVFMINSRILGASNET